MSPIALWSVLAVAYAGFMFWYRSWKGPLTPEEVERYVGMMKAGNASDEAVAEQRRFLEADDGRDFVMVNVIEFRDEPTQVGDVQPGETSAKVLGRYMAYMWPALLRRACHPVIGGAAAAQALDTWGIDKAQRWSQAGLMRYRSRRDLMEIATNPEFAPSHVYKLAAMNKTIAFPISPYQLLGGAPLVVGLALLAAGAFLQLAFGA